MKKSHFVSLVFSVMGILLFGMGMCMSLLPEWQLLNQGIIIGIIGLVILLMTVIIYRKMEHKKIIKVTRKGIFISVVSLVGVLGLGSGMCLTMVYDQFIFGIVIGVVGIGILLSLIPLCKGLK